MERNATSPNTGWQKALGVLPSTNVAIGLLLLGMCLFVFVAQKGLHSIEGIKQHHDASREALQNSILISETMSLVKDVETGQRGFMITGDEGYLAPYFAALASFEETYRQLVDNLSGRQQQQSAENLDRLLQQRIQLAAFLIEERKRLGSAVLDDASLYREGRRIMDEIRAEVARLHADQFELSERRNLEARSIQQRSFHLNLWVSISGTLLLVLSAFFLVREKRIRDRAQRKLHRANATLEGRIEESTAQLQTALERIQKFALEQDESIESERRRLAREVHDQLGQVFTSIKLVLLGLKSAPAELHEERVQELTALLDDGVGVARRISSELRPALLDDLGLDAAVNHYTQELMRRGAPRTLVRIERDDLLSPSAANQLFRILQEAFTNVLRHANASLVLIEGSPNGEAGYRFSVTDNGIGPQPIRADASGVRNMRERAMLAGGSFRFEAAPEHGTRIVVIVPCVAGEDECTA